MYNLPSKKQMDTSTLNNTPFLKLYNGMNPTHEADRERADSIVMNLVYRPSVKIKGKFNYFFNKK